MKLLIIARKIDYKEMKHPAPVAPFVYEQYYELRNLNIDCNLYIVERKGILGYLYHLIDVIKLLKKGKYDLLHVHGGHLGTIFNLQRIVPVVTTYHGSDINTISNRIFSFMSLKLSKRNIFVSKSLFNRVKKICDGVVIPCGVDFSIFRPMDKFECRRNLQLGSDQKCVLFAGQKERKIKNYPLAVEATKLAGVDNLIELNNYSREEVALMLNACDAVLMTSFSEGSPMIIKEAMACNTPIVTTNVGDVSEVIGNVEGCYISGYDPVDIAAKLELAINHGRTTGRRDIDWLQSGRIAQQLISVYNSVLN
jgi:teichuronic acid biosynthesis glycosyltransferase TuaC